MGLKLVLQAQGTGQGEPIGLEKKDFSPLQKPILLRTLPRVSAPAQLTAERGKSVSCGGAESRQRRHLLPLRVSAHYAMFL